SHIFSLYSYVPPLVLHSFPTRRSSDLMQLLVGCAGRPERELVDAVAGEARVRVTVDESRDRAAAAAVEFVHVAVERGQVAHATQDRKSTRLNSSHDQISYAVFCLKKKK